MVNCDLKSYQEDFWQTYSSLTFGLRAYTTVSRLFRNNSKNLNGNQGSKNSVGHIVVFLLGENSKIFFCVFLQRKIPLFFGMAQKVLLDIED